MKKFIIIAIIVLFTVTIGKDLIAKAAIEQGVSAVTGLDLTMDKFKLGLTDSLVSIKGLKLYNPDNFEEEVMVDLPEIHIQVDIPAFFKGTTHIKEMRLNLAEFSVIKNKDGEVNLDTLKALTEGDPSKPKKDQPKKDSKPMDLQIDKLVLKVNKVQYIDHTALGKLSSQSFDARIDETFTNITDPKVLVATIVTKVLKNTTIGRLADIDVGAFGNVASGVMTDTKKMAEDAVGSATKALDSIKKDVNIAKAGDSVKDATSSIKDATGGLLGSLKSKVDEVTS